MKTFYIRDVEGTIPSCDGKVMYREIRGKEILTFFREEENRSRCFVRGSDCEDAQESWFEVDAALMPMAERAKRRERYLREERERASLQILSLEELCSGTEADPIALEETLASDEPGPEELMILEAEKTALRAALKTLDEEAQSLIYALFLQDEPMTLRGYAALYGLPFPTVQSRKNAALRRLRALLG